MFDNAVGPWVNQRLVSVHEPHQVRRLSFRTAHFQDFPDVFLHADVAALDVNPVTNGRVHGAPSLQPDRRTYSFIGERAAQTQVIARGHDAAMLTLMGRAYEHACSSLILSVRALQPGFQPGGHH